MRGDLEASCRRRATGSRRGAVAVGASALARWLLILLASGCHLLAGFDDIEPPPERSGSSLEVAWMRRVNGGDQDSLGALAVDEDGNVIVGGHFDTTVDWGGGPMVNVDNPDIFVAKLSPEGEHIWSRSYGNPRAVTIRGMATGRSGDVFFTGRLRETVDIGGPLSSNGSPLDATYVVRLDAGGEVVWTRLLKGPDQQQRPFDLAVSYSGDVVVVGEFDGTSRFEHGDKSAEITATDELDAFVLVLDEDGELRWLQGFGGELYDRASAVVTDGNDFVVAGTTFDTLELDGGSLTTRGSSDPFILRLDGKGRLVWGATMGDVERNCHEWCEQALAVDDERRVFHTGAFTGRLSVGDHALQGSYGADVWAFSYEERGLFGEPKPRWSASFGDDAVQRADAATMLEGRIPVTAGRFWGEMDFGGGPLVNADDARDVFLAGFEPDGSHRFSLALPISHEGDDKLIAPHVAATPDGDLITAGSFQGTLRAGDEVRHAEGSEGARDFFVLRIVGSSLASAP